MYSGSALVEAGPAGVLIDYSIVGCVVFLVMSALGEMVSYMPLPRELFQVSIAIGIIF
jgi:amino acid transporter